jgi:cytochrome c2
MAALLTGGDRKCGWALMARDGCAACHSIPGVPGAKRKVGPPLDGMAAALTGSASRWASDSSTASGATSRPRRRP